MIYVAYHRNGKLAGAMLAHTTLFAALVARMAGIQEGECERTVAEIGPDESRRIPAGMIGRLLGEKDVRELMERLATAKPPRKRRPLARKS